MADTEFEEFRNIFETLPQHIRAPAQTYTLVHDVVLDEDSPTSSKSSDHDIGEEISQQFKCVNSHNDYPVVAFSDSRSRLPSSDGSLDSQGTWPNRPSGERRRRKLPEIPKNKKPAVLSLADELGTALSLQLGTNNGVQSNHRSFLMLKCHSYLRDEDSSPDSDRFQSTDVDSGNSTAHSPELKSTSPQIAHRHEHHSYSYTTIGSDDTSASPSSSGGIPFTQLELLEATHRGLHKFIPRHRDELEVEIGDPIYVQKEADDLWCEGTGRQGVFPSAYAVDLEFNDFDPSTPKVKRERFMLGYLGSVETLCHKGNSVLCQAVRKIVATKHKPHSCILEVSDQGLRMVDKSKPSGNSTPCHDYFYSLKNVSFCAFHPQDHRYMGFITKHPQLQRFACHVFLGCESTRPIAESVGRAFQRFYTKFIETAYPIEDIYIE